MHWITVEVFDGGFSPAALWADAWRDRLLEFTFDDERARDAFRDSPLFRAALDHAPDRVLVYPHRGGGDGIRQPRRPRPLLRSGGAEIPPPDPDTDRICPCTPVAAPVEGLAVSW